MEVELVCFVNSKPPSQVQFNNCCFPNSPNYGHVVPSQAAWFRSNTRLATTDRLYIKTRHDKITLIVDNVDPTYFGNYSCQASNELGRARAYLTLSGLSLIHI